MRSWIKATLLAGLLAGCVTPRAGSFDPAHANRVTNGMTREQVIAIMGSQPAWARADGATLTWEQATGGLPGETPAPGDTITSATFHFDRQGKTFGIPAGGIYGGVEKPAPSPSPLPPEPPLAEGVEKPEP